MVDLQATNAKLRTRSIRMIGEVCGVNEDAAGRLLKAAGGRVKTAIVMQALGLTRAEAERRLAQADGRVREVVPGPPPPIG
jgi:N-acetylmuramic acid 6-phosphate etherase